MKIHKTSKILNLLIIKTSYFLISKSLLYFSKINLKFNSSFNNDFLNILKTIDSKNRYASHSYINNLVMAEDHRYFLHYGIDFIAILRALKSIIIDRKYQGASTIEQQLVRVSTYRYERSLRRKIREQLLAILISNCRSKKSIATAYLEIAYFGYSFQGYISLNSYIKENLIYNFEAFTVSLLKYPVPKNKNHEWHLKIQNRIRYIQKRNEKYTIYLKK